MTASPNRLDVLVLYRHEDPTRMQAAISAHLRVLDLVPDRVRVVYANAIAPVAQLVRRTRFDAIVLHTTFLGMRWHNQFALFAWDNRWIAEHPASKIAMPQDEYDRCEILDEWLAAWGVSVVFSNFGEQHRRLLYRLTPRTAHFEKCFTGYVDERVADRVSGANRPLTKRPLDIVYRAQSLPYSFGSHGQLKSQVADVVSAAAARHDLAIDISTRAGDTILGDDWLNFIGSARTVVGVESGSSALDRRGEIRSAVQRMISAAPAITFDRVSERLPANWDSYSFLALGPRHFEAVASRTAQLLVEGAYEGVLIPNRHYLPLKRDWSNLDETLERVRDANGLQRIADCAYDEIFRSGHYSYRRFAAQVADAIERAREEHPVVVGRRAPVTPAVAASTQRAAELARRIRLRGRHRLEASTLVGAASRYAQSPDTTLQLARFVSRELGAPEARRVLLLALRRRQLGSHGLPADLIRLASVAAARNGSGMPFFVDVKVESDLLHLHTVVRQPGSGDDDDGMAAGPAIADGRVRRILWDHSAVGDMLELPIDVPLTVPLDGAGHWSFRALGDVLASGSSDARAVLTAAVGHRGQDGRPS